MLVCGWLRQPCLSFSLIFADQLSENHSPLSTILITKLLVLSLPKAPLHACLHVCCFKRNISDMSLVFMFHLSLERNLVPIPVSWGFYCTSNLIFVFCETGCKYLVRLFKCILISIAQHCASEWMISQQFKIVGLFQSGPTRKIVVCYGTILHWPNTSCSGAFGMDEFCIFCISRPWDFDCFAVHDGIENVHYLHYKIYKQLAKLGQLRYFF